MGVVCECSVSNLECKNWVVCVACTGGVVRGGRLLAPKLGILSAVSILSISRCARIF